MRARLSSLWRGTKRFFRWLWFGRPGARMLWPRRVLVVAFTLIDYGTTVYIYW